MECSQLRVSKVELECRVKVLSDKYLSEVRHCKFLEKELDKLRFPSE